MKNGKNINDWHLMDAEAVCAHLGSSREGISSLEAQQRLATYGPNTIRQTRSKSPLLLLLNQFRDFMILVLIGAALVAGVMGEITDTFVIAAIVLLNALIGFIQEYRAEQAMAALRNMASPETEVIRGGKRTLVGTDSIVPGDVVLLQAGTIVPADLRLLETALVKIEEAALTGESVPVEKHAKPLMEADLPLGDRRNLVFKGTIVTSGRATGIVVGTGLETELGKIAGMLEGVTEEKTPLQRRLALFGQRLSLVILLICILIFIAGLMRGEEPLTMLLTAISLAVAAIPEALPAVVTISLALGAGKMARKHALIKNLPAVETLGSVTHICTDKTGTLTRNRMKVTGTYLNGGLYQTSQMRMPQDGDAEPLRQLCLAMSLNNDAWEGDGGELGGDPTETALYEAARTWGYDPAELKLANGRLTEIPFDEQRKCMTTFHRSDDGIFAFTKGAPEVILDRCNEMLTSSGLSALDRPSVEVAGERMAAAGQRVLAFAMRRWEQLPSLEPQAMEQQLTFLGLVGMIDPPRDEALEAVTTCIDAGIVPVMITGDHPVTARAIAESLAILPVEGTAVMTGTELAILSPHEFARRVMDIRVYARVAPAQKFTIVKALQDSGCFVAMTGDGVNDAPALKRADIGISMGITGTDVAREASDMILLDDNFATIITAVQEGRRIFDNIRKFVKYAMTGNSGEIWTIALAPFLDLPLPLLPVHLLWINLVTDGLPGIALAAEPAEPGLMKKPPRLPDEDIFAHGLGLHIIWVGLLMGCVSIATQVRSMGGETPAHWQTMVFTVLCLSQMGHALAIRSEKESLFRQGLLSNKPLLGAVLLTLALQLLIIYVPVLNPIFKTHPLPLKDLVFALFLSSVVFAAVELEKLVKRRRVHHSSASA